MKINDKYEISPFGNAFESLFSLLARNEQPGKSSANSYFSECGKVRIRNSEKEAKIEFLVPGWKKSDLALTVEEQKLRLSSSTEGKKDQIGWFQSNELNYEIRLGQDLDTSKVNAKLEEGVLTVVIPVCPKAKGKSIKIS